MGRPPGWKGGGGGRPRPHPQFPRGGPHPQFQGEGQSGGKDKSPARGARGSCAKRDSRPRAGRGASPALALALALALPQYIPPMPPPGIDGAFSGSFFSTTTASVVSRRLAMDAAFWSAVRVTLVGSITPASTRSSYLSAWAL